MLIIIFVLINYNNEGRQRKSALLKWSVQGGRTSRRLCININPFETISKHI
jgi:hypothetical protein